MLFHIFFLPVARPKPGHGARTKRDAALSDKQTRCS
jgi:hypothetical protein